MLTQLLYLPTAVTSVLTARAFADRPNAIVEAAAVHAVCWVAQFIGHGAAEKRAPALLDNIVGGMLPILHRYHRFSYIQLLEPYLQP